MGTLISVAAPTPRPPVLKAAPDLLCVAIHARGDPFARAPRVGLTRGDFCRTRHECLLGRRRGPQHQLRGDSPSDSDSSSSDESRSTSSGPSNAAPDAEGLKELERLGHLDVYMTPVHLPRYNHLAFAYVNPPTINTAITIGDALLRDHRRLRGSMAPSLYPHIVHSVGPVANPHFLDPVCITSTNFSTVIITLKAENMVDVPLTMNYKNHDGLGSVGRISITHIGVLDGDVSSSSSSSFEDGGDDDNPGSTVQANPGAEDPPPASDITVADASGPTAGATSCSVRHKMDAGRTPFHSRSRAQCIEDVGLALISAKGWKCMLPMATALPQLDEPLSLDVNLGLDGYMICARFANGAINTFKVPLQPYKDKLAPDRGFFIINLCTGFLGLIHGIARVDTANRVALTVDTILRDA